MILQKGDIKKETTKAQKLISLAGYDLIIDGHFGQETEDAVKEFQQDEKLKVDGIIGKETWQELLKFEEEKEKEYGDKEIAYKKENLKVNKYHLDDDQYIKERHVKDKIFLHHTAGNESAKKTIDWWDSNETRIATAYVISRKGQIYEAFNPDFYSYHLGVKGTRGKLDKHSIGIELCNWGPLKYDDGRYYKWPYNYSRYSINKKEAPYKFKKTHRGHKYFQNYSSEQIESLKNLIIFLIEEYNIDISHQEFDDSWFEYKPDLIENETEGIWTHVNVRKDKNDLYPHKGIIQMLKEIQNEFAISK